MHRRRWREERLAVAEGLGGRWAVYGGAVIGLAALAMAEADEPKKADAKADAKRCTCVAPCVRGPMHRSMLTPSRQPCQRPSQRLRRTTPPPGALPTSPILQRATSF